MNGLRVGTLLALALLIGGNVAQAQESDSDLVKQMKEDDRAAPIDWGYGPGVKPSQVGKGNTTGKTAKTTTTTTTTTSGGK